MKENNNHDDRPMSEDMGNFLKDISELQPGDASRESQLGMKIRGQQGPDRQALQPQLTQKEVEKSLEELKELPRIGWIPGEKESDPETGQATQTWVLPNNRIFKEFFDENGKSVRLMYVGDATPPGQK